MEFAHQPLHPAFVGVADVTAHPDHIAKKLNGPKFRVDLGAGTCTCPNGAAEQMHIKRQELVSNIYCSHKLRAIADIIEEAKRPPDMLFAYAKALASRYNVYEVVSAFHKELRRGDIEKAVFWGAVLCTFRGAHGVMKYLLGIMYEETRDHTFNRWLLDRLLARDHSWDTMTRAIALFCQSKKKWELPHRYRFLMAEMQGYQRLIQEYGRDVAKQHNILHVKERGKLTAALLQASAIEKLKVDDAALALLQYGLKGLQKLQCGGDGKLDHHRAAIINLLCEQPAVKPSRRRPGYAELERIISDRAANGFGVGYHELNAFADFLAGEPYGAGNTSPEKLNAVLAAPAPALRLGVAPVIPIYAQDNHTWAGKALIRRFPSEWLPGATQEHMDLRLCGAYIGVSWRHLAMKQFQRIDCDWGVVNWPKWWSDTVANLWY